MSETFQPPDLVAVTGLDGCPHITVSRNLLVVMIFSKIIIIQMYINVWLVLR